MLGTTERRCRRQHTKLVCSSDSQITSTYQIMFYCKIILPPAWASTRASTLVTWRWPGILARFAACRLILPLKQVGSVRWVALYGAIFLNFPVYTWFHAQNFRSSMFLQFSRRLQMVWSDSLRDVAPCDLLEVGGRFGATYYFRH